MFLTFLYIIRTRQHGWRALWNTVGRNWDLNQNCSAILNIGMYNDNRTPSTPPAMKIICGISGILIFSRSFPNMEAHKSSNVLMLRNITQIPILQHFLYSVSFMLTSLIPAFKLHTGMVNFIVCRWQLQDCQFSWNCF